MVIESLDNPSHVLEELANKSLNRTPDASTGVKGHDGGDRT